MSAYLLCPACHAPLVYHRVGATCSQCQTTLPSQVQKYVELQLLRGSVQQPMLLRLGRIVSGVVACATGATLAAWLAGGSGPVAWSSALPFVALGVGAGVVAVGLTLERRWARPAALALWTGASILVLKDGLFDTEAWNRIFSLVPLGLSVEAARWYLYAKTSVVRYYRMLKLEAANASPTA